MAYQVQVTAAGWEYTMHLAAERVFEQERRAILALCGEAKSRALSRKATVDVRWLENNVSEWLRQQGGPNWRQALVPLLEAIVTEQGTVSATQFGVTFDVRNPYVSAFIGRLMDKFTKDVTQTTRDAIGAELRAGDEAGESLGQLIQRISRYYDENAGHRAEVTARTETLNAANAGAVVAYEEAGCKQWEWLATDDERECDECAALNGQRFPVAHPFEVAHPQCRCCALPVLPEAL